MHILSLLNSHIISAAWQFLLPVPYHAPIVFTYHRHRLEGCGIRPLTRDLD